MKLTIKEIKSAMQQWTFDGGCTTWRKFCDFILPPKGTTITKDIANKINQQLTHEEIVELKSII
jgi:hypothetical protein